MSGAKAFHLEDYVSYFNNHAAESLTCDQIFKICRINSHGRFKRNKADMLELLRTMELIPAGRSTVGECPLRYSSGAELSMAEVLKDIESIGWQEYPIGSIMTVSNEYEVGTAEETALISTNSVYGSAKKKDRDDGEPDGSVAKRKRKSVAPKDRIIGISSAVDH